MTLAALYDGPYNVVYLLHIISVIIGTGAAFVLPLLATRMRAAGTSTTEVDAVSAMVLTPALLAAGVFGGALVGMSDDFYDFGQTWLAIAGVIWLVTVAAAALAHPPSYLPVPDLAQHKAMVTGVMHLSLAIMLVLMVWKFGSPW